jgi:hypothetical protein
VPDIGGIAEPSTGAEARDARMIVSSSPRSSHTPQHFGQKSIATEPRSAGISRVLQLGHFMGKSS